MSFIKLLVILVILTLCVSANQIKRLEQLEEVKGIETIYDDQFSDNNSSKDDMNDFFILTIVIFTFAVFLFIIFIICVLLSIYSPTRFESITYSNYYSTEYGIEEV